jgi:putative oxidoreductase
MMREFFIQHGFPGYFVGLAGILECVGGGLLLIGLFTRPAALLLAAEMWIAIWKVKMVHGVFAVNEYQFELALAAGCVALATVGAGSLSVDHVMLGDSGGAKRRVAKRDRD